MLLLLFLNIPQEATSGLPCLVAYLQQEVGFFLQKW